MLFFRLGSEVPETSHQSLSFKELSTFDRLPGVLPGTAPRRAAQGSGFGTIFATGTRRIERHMNGMSATTRKSLLSSEDLPATTNALAVMGVFDPGVRSTVVCSQRWLSSSKPCRKRTLYGRRWWPSRIWTGRFGRKPRRETGKPRTPGLPSPRIQTRQQSGRHGVRSFISSDTLSHAPRGLQRETPGIGTGNPQPSHVLHVAPVRELLQAIAAATAESFARCGFHQSNQTRKSIQYMVEEV